MVKEMSGRRYHNINKGESKDKCSGNKCKIKVSLLIYLTTLSLMFANKFAQVYTYYNPDFVDIATLVTAEEYDQRYGDTYWIGIYGINTDSGLVKIKDYNTYWHELDVPMTIEINVNATLFKTFYVPCNVDWGDFWQSIFVSFMVITLFYLMWLKIKDV